MNIKDIDLNLLNVFSAIYKEQNISRAADRLGLSQPATSNALNRLRKMLDDPLFVRNSRGVTATPRAHELAEPIDKAFDLIQTSLNKKSDFKYRSAKRTFNIAMSDYCDFLLLPKLMEWIASSAPNIRINVWPIDGGNISELFDRGKLDLAIGNIPFLGDSYRKQRLFEEDFIVLIRNTHPRAKDQFSLDDFASLPHIIFTPRHTHSTQIDLLLKKHNLQRTISLQVSSFLSLPAIVAKSDHIATCPLRVALAFRDIYPIKMMKLPLDFGPATISQFWTERVHNEPGVIWLRQLMFELCQRI